MNLLLKDFKKKTGDDNEQENNALRCFVLRLGDLANLGRDMEHGSSDIINRYSYLRYFIKCVELSPEEKRKSPEHMMALRKAAMFVHFFESMGNRRRYKELNILDRMLKRLQIEKHSENSIIYNHGDHSDKFYVILQGIVVMLKHSHENVVKAEKHALKTLIELSNNKKTIDNIELKKLIEQIPKDLPDEILEAAGKFSSITDGIVNYKSKVLKTHWRNIDPTGINTMNIFDEKTGVQIYDFCYTLKTGESFGKAGIDNEKPRIGFAVSLVDTTLAYVTREVYKEVLLPIELKKFEVQKKFFVEHVFKSDVLGNAKEKIVKHFSKVKYKQNMHLYKEGDDIHSMFVIAEGNVKL